MQRKESLLAILTDRFISSATSSFASNAWCKIDAIINSIPSIEVQNTLGVRKN